MIYHLALGLNDYPGTANDLAGCANDAEDLLYFVAAGANEVKARRLLDAEATRQGVFAEIRRLADAAVPGDEVFLTYSGHGTWYTDQDGDEADSRDEALCLYDGDVLDDEIDEALGMFQPGVRLGILSDSCHSGGITRGMIGRGAPGASVAGVRFRAPEAPESSIWLPMRHRVWCGTRFSCRPQASRVVLTGCNALEYSYDASFGGRPNGAFTRTALDVFEEGMTWRQWHEAIRGVLPSGEYPQSPQLEGDETRFDERVFR